MMAPLTVIFAGGGTGGHLFPGLAVAEALKVRLPDVSIRFVGSKKKIESRVVPQAGYPFHAIWIEGLKRSFSLSTLTLPVKLLVSLFQSFFILRAKNPNVVVGTGGYVSGPLVFTAAKMRVPTLILEQNNYPGLATRTLSHAVDEVHVTFAESAKLLPRAKKLVVSGNPVRLSLSKSNAFEAREYFGLKGDLPTVFVFGGSLGARSINNAIRTLLQKISEQNIQMIWQTGSNDYALLADEARQWGSNITVHAFIDEMNVAYSASSLAICRAGATSLAELTVLGIPSILIPYPYATANHQLQNARAMEEAGAAVVVEDVALTQLRGMLFELIRNADRLSAMSAAAKRIGKPNAAFDIADAVIRLSHARGTV